MAKKNKFIKNEAINFSHLFGQLDEQIPTRKGTMESFYNLFDFLPAVHYIDGHFKAYLLEDLENEI